MAHAAASFAEFAVCSSALTRSSNVLTCPVLAQPASANAAIKMSPRVFMVFSLVLVLFAGQKTPRGARLYHIVGRGRTPPCGAFDDQMMAERTTTTREETLPRGSRYMERRNGQ